MVCAEGRREGRAGADVGGWRGGRGTLWILGWLNRRDRPETEHLSIWAEASKSFCENYSNWFRFSPQQADATGKMKKGEGRSMGGGDL